MSVYTTETLDTQAPAFDYVKQLAAAATHADVRDFDDDFLKRYAEIQQFDTDQTGITPMMGYFLFCIAAQMRHAQVVSMGSYSGISTAFLLGGTVADARGNLTCIEPDNEKYQLTRRNLMSMSDVKDRVAFINCEPLEWVATDTGEVDLLFIDVTHPTREKADYAAIAARMLHRMTQGSIILAHDALVGRWNADITAYEAVLDSSGRCQWHRRMPVDETGISLGVLR